MLGIESKIWTSEYFFILLSKSSKVTKTSTLLILTPLKSFESSKNAITSISGSAASD